MYGIIKYAGLVFIVIAIAGCAAFRKGRATDTVAEPGGMNYAAVIDNVVNNNIAEKGFEIRKGTIELRGTEIEGKFGLHARLNSRGDFYGSVRGPLGIELVRLLMVGNDIAAIDRFNKTVYIGKKDDILKKNGMPEDFMEIIFGDMPAENVRNFSYGENSQLKVTAGDENFIREISICPDEMKICNQRIDAIYSGQEIYITFGEFGTSGGKRYPSVIEMSEGKRMFHVKLLIDDLIYGYDSDIEFNLPSYRRESL
ncbi:MAG: DUF4292 domain-containing protein [Bacteroidales bacterium]|jgi:hypothetical protein|nr:DUF4292 domain-containing protein [Bacteroidales bacterium]